MALSFDGTADYITWSSFDSILTEGNLFSGSIWLNKSTSTVRRALHVSMVDATPTNYGVQITVNGDAGSYIHVVSLTSTSKLRATASNSVWHHVCFTVNAGAAATIASAYLNGVAMTDTAGDTWGTGTFTDSCRVGARSDAAFFYGGNAADLAFWNNYTLTAADAAALKKGASPFVIKPSALVFFSRLDGRGTAAKNLIGGQVATHTSAPPYAEHPIASLSPMYGYARQAAAVGGGLSIPVAMHHYARLRA